MRKLTQSQRRTVDEAEHLVGANGHAITGFSRHVIDTVAKRLRAMPGAAVSGAEIGLIELAVDSMRAAAGRPVPTVAE